MDAERKLLISHLQNHKKKLNCLIKDKDQISAQIVNSSSNIFLILIQRNILMNLSKDNYIQLNIKVNKLRRLKPQNTYNYNVPVINISSKDLNTTQLKYGLHHCFIDKNKFTKQNVAIEMENLATNLNKFIKDDQREEFHNFLRSSTNIISKNIFHSKDHTFSKLNELRKDDTIVILPADKESSCVIMDKDDYINKVSCMITEGITDMKYTHCDDTILKDLKNFQSFLYRNFKNHENYKEIYPSSHQAARFFSSAKTHKFKNIEDINLQDLKLRPIIDQTGSCFYKASQVLSRYLQLLSNNEYNI